MTAFARITLFVSTAAIGAVLYAETRSHNTGATPAGLAPGGPDNFSSANEFENINLYNGNLSVAIPLLRIGGRGGAGYTMMVTPSGNHLQLSAASLPEGGGYRHGTLVFGSEPGRPDVGYSPGFVFLKRSADGVSTCPSTTFYTNVLTEVVFLKPDGGQQALYSVASPSGNRSYVDCTPGSQNTNRGSVFKALDGSGFSFVSSTVIHDSLLPSSPTRRGGPLSVEHSTGRTAPSTS